MNNFLETLAQARLSPDKSGDWEGGPSFSRNSAGCNKTELSSTSSSKAAA